MSSDYVKSLDARLTRIETKLDNALRFKWVVVGVTTGVTSLFGIIITIMSLLSPV